MTYFHTGCSTIIGAKSFHGPVRDGKGWDQLAMVIRHDLSVVCRAAGSSPGTRHIQPKGEEAATSSPAVCRKAMQRSMSCLAGCEYRTSRTTQRRYNRQGYRDKPHGQLVLVSLTHYCASTPSLSTSWSRTTLQGAQGPGKTHLETSFPLRCFQRLSLPHLATRQCHWRDNRYTRGASTPVLSY